MRHVSRWVVGVASALAIWRLWTRRRRDRVAPPTVEPDPAEELRRKLAESREHPEPGAAEPEPAAKESLEERRARVHAKAQEAAAAMREEHE